MHLTWENYLIWKIVSYLNYELLNYYIHVAKRLRYCLHYHKGNVKHNIFYKLLYCMNLQQHLYIYQSTMFYLKMYVTYYFLIFQSTNFYFWISLVFLAWYLYYFPQTTKLLHQYKLVLYKIIFFSQSFGQFQSIVK